MYSAIDYIRNLVGWEMPCEDATEDLDFKVTREHCVKGVRSDPTKCAGALGLVASGWDGGIVQHSFTHVWDKKRIRRFTNGRKLQDFQTLNDVRRGRPAVLTLHAPTPGRTMEAAKRNREATEKNAENGTKRPYVRRNHVLPHRVLARKA